jgi:hypothetical protein
MDKKLLEEHVFYRDGHFYGLFNGKKKGSFDTHGRIQVLIAGKRYSEHRLVWLWFNGEFPDGDLDHINRNPADNRIENLRIVTRSQNKQNSGLYKNNTSGFKGVCLAGKWGTWKASIAIDRKRYYLGSFETKELAYQRYLEAVRELHTHSPLISS